MKTVKQAITLLLVALFSAGAMTVYQAGADEGKSETKCVGSIDYNKLTAEELSALYQKRTW
ncbi:MAG TPA: hypothetical protein VIR61_00975 [Sulfuricaulis sp.]